jgi:16S rRNA (guanine(1405)-N(7))-methyltransferase
VAAQEMRTHANRRAALDAARKKLHNIVAPYLGDPDYHATAELLSAARRSGDFGQIKAACRQALAAHASTAERLPILDGFYPRLWQVTGKPDSLLDLACGLNPLAFPWMELPCSTRYHAYDLHRPRLALINHFFTLQGLAPLAEQRDILVSPPEIEAPVALFFKEAHRFEQRQRGCNRRFWQALHTHWLLVSLPTSSLSGKHDLVERQRRLVYGTLEGLDWPVSEVHFGNEIVFCIEKRTGDGRPLE